MPGLIRLVFTLSALAAGLMGAPAAEYPNHKSLTQQLKKIASAHKKIVKLDAVAESIGKREVWFVELGAGKEEERKKRPALLVVAGIEGNDLVGTVSVVSWLNSLAEAWEKDEAIKKLLDTTSHIM